MKNFNKSLLNRLAIINKKQYVKNFSLLLSGNVVSQLIPLIIAPLISRLYAIQDFALLALLFGVSSMISIGATLQYESAIVLPTEDLEAARLLILSLVLIFLTTIISSLVIPFRNQIGLLLNSDVIANKLFLVPIFVMLTSLFRTFNFWAIRKKMFKSLSARQIGQTTTQSISKIFLGFFSETNYGLIIGTLLGYLTSSGILIYQSFKENIEILKKAMNIKEILSTAKKYKRFPFYTLPHGYGDMLMKDGVVFIISSFYGANVLGAYSFTSGILNKPMSFIGNSLRSVFYQRAAELAGNPKGLWSFTKKNFIIQTLSGLIIFSPIFFFGDYLFAFVFGAKWMIAGTFSKYMSIWVLCMFLMSPFSSLPLILGKQKQFLFIATTLNIVILVVFIVGAKELIEFKNILGVVSGISILSYIFTVLWLKRLILNGSSK